MLKRAILIVFLLVLPMAIAPAQQRSPADAVEQLQREKDAHKLKELSDQFKHDLDDLYLRRVKNPSADLTLDVIAVMKHMLSVDIVRLDSLESSRARLLERVARLEAQLAAIEKRLPD